ncbi:spastin-like [Pyrus x bretschneideri]|uniref:spastin-like n=1 Tax=Pyrus x bretschneideri TaxID=225117 RepID=UPI00202F10F1|nr:spastin-like [Pyrus x bretschneideri]
MKVEKAPLESYADIGGWDAQIQEIKEAVELPLTHPELYEDIGIRPPKGVILYGVPETGKISLARAVANSTLATFLRVVFSPKFSISPSHLNSQVEFTSHAKTEFANPSPSNFTHTANRWVSTQVSSRVQSLTDSANPSPSHRICNSVGLNSHLIPSSPSVHCLHNAILSSPLHSRFKQTHFCLSQIRRWMLSVSWTTTASDRQPLHQLTTTASRSPLGSWLFLCYFSMIFG